MKNDDKEKWIEQLRTQMDGYSENVPEDVWNSLEKDLNYNVVPFWKRWQGIAALIAVVIGSVITIMTWLDSAPSKVMQDNGKAILPVLADEAEKDNDISFTKKGNDILTDNYIKRNSIRKEKKGNIENNAVIASTDVDALSEKGNDNIIDDNISKKSDNTNKSTKDSESKTNSSSVSQNKPVVKEHKNYYLAEANRSKSRKWSVGINSGGLGVNSSSDILGAQMRFSTNSNANNNNMMSDCVNGGILFDNNKFYANIQSFNKMKTKKKHYQPITFGLSLQFELDKDWALESGVTYTYLLSKLESWSANSSFKQEQKLRYVGIPLKISRNIFRAKNFSAYGSAGGEIEKCISGKQKTVEYENDMMKSNATEDIDIDRLQFSLSASFGAEYEMARNMSLYAEPGIVYYFDDKSGIETIRNEKPFNFSLKLGLRFSFSK